VSKIQVEYRFQKNQKDSHGISFKITLQNKSSIYSTTRQIRIFLQQGQIAITQNVH